MVLNLYLSQEEKLPISSRRDDFAEKRPLVVTLNPSVPQDKLREGSQVWETMRFFVLLRMTNRFDGGVSQQNQDFNPDPTGEPRFISAANCFCGSRGLIGVNG